MASITVSNLNEGIVQRLKAQADANSRTLEDEAAHILEQAVESREDGRAARVRAFFENVEPLLEKQRQRQNAGDVGGKPSWLIIREDRDSDHGRLYDPWGLDDSRS